MRCLTPQRGFALSCCLASVAFVASLGGLAHADGGDWAATVSFPPSEKPVALFNGKDFEGWEGNTGENGTTSISRSRTASSWPATQPTTPRLSATIC